MLLKDFVSNALIEICEGISKAKQSVLNYAVAPHCKTNADGTKENTGDMEYIDFEIGVAIEESSSNSDEKFKSAGFLKVMSAEIGKNTSAKSQSTNNYINKISFRVPFLPQAQALFPTKNAKNE